MKFRTALCVAFLGLSALACGGGGSASSYDYSVSLTEPWTGMSLPTSGGSVIYSDSYTMSAMYDGGSAATLGGDYDKAIQAAGWSQTFKTDDATTFTATYSKGTETMTLAASDFAGSVTVSVSKF